MTSTQASAPSGLPMFAMRPAPAMGNGLFATCPIKKGTRIIAEAPILSLPPELGNAPEEVLVSNFCKAVYDLPPDQLAKIDGLFHEPRALAGRVTPPLAKAVRAWHHHHQGRVATNVEDAAKLALKRLAIFSINCVAMGAGQKYGSGLFELYSRINHSCVPNVFNSYNATIKLLTVHAVRDIEVGEQIFTCYADSFCRDFEQRQAFLKHWSFSCACSACSDRATTDPVRKRMLYLDQELAMYNSPFRALLDSGGKTSTALDNAKRLANLLVSQGMGGMELCKAYRDCAKLCIEMGKLKQALGFARKELEIERDIVGTETEHLKEDLVGAEYFLQSLEMKT